MPLKLRYDEPSQYLDGWLLSNSRYCAQIVYQMKQNLNNFYDKLADRNQGPTGFIFQ